MDSFVTPYDNPRKIWEKLAFPGLRVAWEQGYIQCIKDSNSDSPDTSGWRDALQYKRATFMTEAEEDEFFLE